MLIRAQNNYGTNLFDVAYTLSKSRTVDNQTGLAIKAIIKYHKSGVGFSILTPKPTCNILMSPFTDPNAVIFADDTNYIFLLKCSLAPICLAPGTRKKIDFYNDPLVTQALSGKLDFAAFKTAAEVKDGKTCDEISPTCGVNPITGTPGVRDDPFVRGKFRPGGLGNIRPGDRGAGGFRERTGGAHDGLDISAPLGTPVYANRAGTITTSSWSGKTLVIKHSGGISTLYAHLSKYEVTGGQVDQGQLIGYSGESGNAEGLPVAERHVHFGVFSGEGIPETKGARWINPAIYLNSPCPKK